MDLDQYIRFLMALLFVVALIMVVAWVLRRIGMAGGVSGKPRARQRRLSVVEALPVDAKRRLLLVRRDDREHLILLSANGDLLLDSAPAGGFDGAMANNAMASNTTAHTGAAAESHGAAGSDAR